MDSEDKREALRVPCEFPVRVYGQMRELAGRLVNVSRTGLRIRVPLSRLMLGSELDIGGLAHAVSQMLGSSFLADLHYEMLGQLIRRRLELVRVGSVDLQSDEVEIACSFEEPLSDEETAMLGVGLPPVGVVTPAAYKNVPPPQHRGEGAKDQAEQPSRPVYEGILHPGHGHLANPLVGTTEGVLGQDVLLALPVRQIPASVGANALSVLNLIKREFGPQPRLEVLDGVLMVWSGPVRLLELEVPDYDIGDILLLCKTL